MPTKIATNPPSTQDWKNCRFSTPTLRRPTWNTILRLHNCKMPSLNHDRFVAFLRYNDLLGTAICTVFDGRITGGGKIKGKCRGTANKLKVWIKTQKCY
ncbi:MAG: hypothetical protein ABFS56_24975 [Pseudomonadota bacterium]